MLRLIMHETNVHQSLTERATKIDTSSVMLLKLNIIAAVLYFMIVWRKFFVQIAAE